MTPDVLSQKSVFHAILRSGRKHVLDCAANVSGGVNQGAVDVEEVNGKRGDHKILQTFISNDSNNLRVFIEVHSGPHKHASVIFKT
jgi:hypothetical protein